MKSTESTEGLSKHLLLTLEMFKCENFGIVGPRGDNNHHFHEVHIIKGDDSYETTAVTSLTEDSILSKSATLKAPVRFRGMSGVCIVFWSEEQYLWSRSLFFHKGCVYQEDLFLEDHHQVPEVTDAFTTPNEEHY